jgi:4-hydroxy-L-threonine phosphate dehydrogenase PdxA
MMLVAPKLRVIHVTTHIGLMDAIRKIEPGLVQRVIAVARDAGEVGHRRAAHRRLRHQPACGRERSLRPGRGGGEDHPRRAGCCCRAKGWLSRGRCPRTRCSSARRRGDFDLVVAMYHDQGHGPVKVMGLEAGVNITIGLPVVRTSVDHGTAFDIAGKGIADERSLLEALRQGAELATRRG